MQYHIILSEVSRTYTTGLYHLKFHSHNPIILFIPKHITQYFPTIQITVKDTMKQNNTRLTRLANEVSQAGAVQLSTPCNITSVHNTTTEVPFAGASLVVVTALSEEELPLSERIPEA